MIKLFPLFSLFLSSLLCSCNQSQHKPNIVNENKGATDSSKIVQRNQTISWIDNFRKLRTAIYQGDKATVKTFFNFPIMVDENNQIWDLVLNQDQLDKFTDLKPFSEQDFDRYFNKIFPKRFVNSILKIKTEELAKNGQYETIELRESNSTYSMTATYDSSAGLLELGLGSKTIFEDDNEEFEFGINYEFVVSENGEIIFLRVILAG